MDLSRWVRHRADWSPERVAVHFRGADVTYRALEGRVGRLAAALASRLGIARGDRVAYLGYNSPLVLELLFACARLGAILIPLNWRLTVAEHRHIVADATPRALFVEPEFGAHADDLRDGALALIACEAAAAHVGTAVPVPEPGDWLDDAGLVASITAESHAGGDLDAPLLIVYTSGTTGRPKGAVLTQGALLWNALNSIAAVDMTSADHVLTVLPMFHVGGLNIHTTPAVLAGATITIARRFDPDETLDLIAARRPTLFLAVPAVAHALSRHPRFAATDLSSLRAMCTGASTVPEAVIRPWLHRGVPVTQVYGMTESGPTAIALSIADAARKVGSCGKPAAHTDARIVDDAGRDVARGQRGEIWLSGPNLSSGYWRNPEATADAFTDGWFHTGDIAHQDADGFFYVDDRKSDVVISGGENVYPAELEHVLAECPDIAEAAVVGRPDDRWGEVAVACVVPRPGSALTRETILALFTDRLARYKHPRDVIFLETLPRTVMGKVQKHELRRRLGEGST
jgi:fatty-acyl-CoA synthase